MARSVEIGAALRRPRDGYPGIALLIIESEASLPPGFALIEGAGRINSRTELAVIPALRFSAAGTVWRLPSQKI